MKTVYVIANINLNDEAAAREAEIDLSDYNQMIIDKWNSCITDEDYIYVFGAFGKGKRAEMRELISQLKGTIYITNYQVNKHFTIEEWKSWGIDFVWNTSFYYKNEEGVEFFFPVQGETIIGPKNGLKENQFIAATQEDNLGTIFKNNMFSLDAKYWDYTPIVLKELPEIVVRLKEYEQMEDK